MYGKSRQMVKAPATVLKTFLATCALSTGREYFNEGNLAWPRR